MAKQLIYDQVAERKRKAEEFLRDVKDNPERAHEVSDESVEHYADRRHFDIIDNPKRRLNSMTNGSQTNKICGTKLTNSSKRIKTCKTTRRNRRYCLAAGR